MRRRSSERSSMVVWLPLRRPPFLHPFDFGGFTAVFAAAAFFVLVAASFPPHVTAVPTSVSRRNRDSSENRQANAPPIWNRDLNVISPSVFHRPAGSIVPAQVGWRARTCVCVCVGVLGWSSLVVVSVEFCHPLPMRLPSQSNSECGNTNERLRRHKTNTRAYAHTHTTCRLKPNSATPDGSHT